MRYCMALDLHDDPRLIAEYERQHRAVWPEVLEHLRAAGVLDMSIWRLGTRLFMIMDTGAGFSFERMRALAAEYPRVDAWEQAMWRFQVPTPWTASGDKWTPMQCIFELGSPQKDCP